MANFSKFTKICVVILLLLTAYFLFRGKDYAKETLKLDSAVVEIIRDYAIGNEELLYESREKHKNGKHLFVKIARQYEVNADFDTAGLLAAVDNAVKDLKFSAAGSIFEKEGDGEKVTALFSFKNRVLYELSFFKKFCRRSAAAAENKSAKIAIVLDDFGYSLNNIDTLFEMDTPLTVSVLPNLPFSERIAKISGEKNIEVILHLPLEPHGGKTNLEKHTILTGMPPQKVIQYLTMAIEGIPGLKGVSNHMGSKATEDRVLMGQIFDELKRRDLYFLDNLVTGRSVCKEVARKKGMRIVARSVFLDNESSEEYIEKQIEQTAGLAKMTGCAIGVGHDRAQTIKTLAKLIPRLKDDGFEFVRVSEIIE
ncbi:MAG: divergent polysaccharide deacetylase family protein [Candidatus Omnitrophota bacterium]|nr:divergent polysaccharide deacetylase family protein [Candidatus Omnitrophota bacterium]